MPKRKIRPVKQFRGASFSEEVSKIMNDEIGPFFSHEN
jgi:hypothetical protein